MIYYNAEVLLTIFKKVNTKQQQQQQQQQLIHVNKHMDTHGVALKRTNAGIYCN